MEFFTLLLIVLMMAKTNNAQVGIRPSIIIHGGAGTISPAHAEAKKVVMIQAIRAGYAALSESDDPQDAVEAAIRTMENSPAFNAGTGSVLSITGEVEMDAIIINGTDLSAGAVGAVRHVKNPISLAKAVKDLSEHVLIVGYEAELFALNNGQGLVPTSQLIANWTKEDNIKGGRRGKRSSYFDVGTVGAVAINTKGNIVAGTSTGGLSGKLNGRVGDTPLVGAGTLADDVIGGISATGWGEAFIRYRVASRVADALERGINATAAINSVLEGMASRIDGADGGAICISKTGELGWGWNSDQMAWAYSTGGVIHYGVDRGEDLTAPLLLDDDDDTSKGGGMMANDLSLLVAGAMILKLVQKIAFLY